MTSQATSNDEAKQSSVLIDFYLTYADGKIAPIPQQIQVRRQCTIYDLIGAFGGHSILQQYAGCYTLWKVCQLQSLACLLQLWQPREAIKDAGDLFAKRTSSGFDPSTFCSAIKNDVNDHKKIYDQNTPAPSTHKPGARHSLRLLEQKKPNCIVVFISALLRVPAKKETGAVDTELENLATCLTKGLLTYSIMLNH